MPKLSVITINYNNRAGLERTFESVMPQLCEDIEYIVIDGASDDGSRELIEKNADALAYWCSEPDGGIYNAMNKGVRHAEGEYLLFLNSGDFLCESDVLARSLPQLRDADIIYGDLIYQDPVGGVRREEIYPDTINADKLLTGSLPHPSSFIRRQLLVDTPYNEELKIVSDWEFFVKKIMWEGCSTRHLPFSISVFMEDGISSRAKELRNRERAQVIKQLFTPAIISVCEEWRAMVKNMQPEFIEIGKTRKLYRRIRPLLRFIIRVNSLVSSKRYS